MFFVHFGLLEWCGLPGLLRLHGALVHFGPLVLYVHHGLLWPIVLSGLFGLRVLHGLRWLIGLPGRLGLHGLLGPADFLRVALSTSSRRSHATLMMNVTSE